MISIFNSNFIFLNLRINDSSKKLKVSNVIYKLYHRGLENKKAYYTLCTKNGKSFYVELVYHPTRGWSYFAENKKEPLFSSLIEKENYFNTAEEAHKKIFIKLNSLFK
jgi:hypothetical protein